MKADIPIPRIIYLDADTDTDTYTSTYTDADADADTVHSAWPGRQMP